MFSRYPFQGHKRWQAPAERDARARACAGPSWDNQSNPTMNRASGTKAAPILRATSESKHLKQEPTLASWHFETVDTGASNVLTNVFGVRSRPRRAACDPGQPGGRCQARSVAAPPTVQVHSSPPVAVIDVMSIGPDERNGPARALMPCLLRLCVAIGGLPDGLATSIRTQLSSRTREGPRAGPDATGGLRVFTGRPALNAAPEDEWSMYRASLGRLALRRTAGKLLGSGWWSAPMMPILTKSVGRGNQQDRARKSTRFAGPNAGLVMAMHAGEVA
jgi:hypothetical protein